MPLEPIRAIDLADADRAAVQDDVMRAVQADPEAFIERYKNDPNSFGGRYVCADLFKESFEQFSASPEARNRYNTPVHNTAAVLAAEQFRRAIADASEPQRDQAVFLTGIPGAGKTSTVLLDGDVPPRARVIYEGQLAKLETTIPKLQQAIDAGLKPVILVVHAQPEAALANTIRRFGEEGRGASINVMASIQGGLPSCLKQVQQHFGDAVELNVIDRRDQFRAQALKGWHHLQVLESEGNYEQIKHRLSTALEGHRAAGTINDACYRQAAGLAPAGFPAAGLDRPVDSALGGGPEPDGGRPGLSPQGGARPTLNQGLTSEEQAVVVGVLKNEALQQLDDLADRRRQARQPGQADSIDQAQGQKPRGPKR